MLQGPASKQARRLKYSAPPVVLAAALALAGCSGGVTASAGMGAANSANGPGGGPACQRIETAWTAFASTGSTSEGDYVALSSAVSDALANNQNLRLAEDAFNLSTDAENISAYGLPAPVAFLTDAQAIAKDCGTTLPLPDGTALPTPKA